MKAALLIALAACNPYPDFDGPADRLPDDPRLGTVVFRGSGGRSIVHVSVSYAFDQLIVAVGENGGYDDNLDNLRLTPQLSVFAITGTNVTRLPDPPVADVANVSIATTLVPGTVLLSYPDHYSFFDGSAWTDIPAQPDNIAVGTTFFAIARSAHEIVAGASFSGTNNYLWEGAAWSQLLQTPRPPGAPSITLEAWSDQRMWFAFQAAGGLCAAPYDIGTQQVGAQICRAQTDTNGAIFAVRAIALSGTSAGFLATAEASTREWRLYRFDGTQWLEGDVVMASDRIDGRPGSTELQLHRGDGSATDATFALDGEHLGLQLVSPFTPMLACTCDRATDPACPCAAMPLDSLLEVSGALDAAALVTLREYDAARAVYARVLPVPITSDPLATPYP